MIDPHKLAAIIRIHRKEAGLSQAQLAEMSGIGKTAVFDIESGKKTVRLDTLNKILKVLNIKVHLTSPLLNQLQINRNEKS